MEINTLLKNPWVKSKNLKMSKILSDLKLVLKGTTVALNANVIKKLQDTRLPCNRNRKEDEKKQVKGNTKDQK